MFNEERRLREKKKAKKAFAKKLRQRMTPQETLLWKLLRDRQLKHLKFRRQVAIGPYIADFLCSQHRLIIELDGRVHDARKEYDKERDAFLESLHYKVVRISNDTLHQSLTDVLVIISQSIYRT
jgi:phosphoribosylformylglycinamidine synthase subunit PurQ / glutaminase